MEMGGPARQPFLAALNVSEIEMRQMYLASCPNQAWQLNQSPKAGHGMNSTDFWLHTFIRNMGLTLGFFIAAGQIIFVYALQWETRSAYFL